MELSITPGTAGFSRKRLWLTGVFNAGMYGAFGVMGHLLWPAAFSDKPLDSIGIGVIFGFLMMVSDTQHYTFKVSVSDDCIIAAYSLHNRSIRKNEVKTVTESDGNIFFPPFLRISKYGSFGTRLWGGIQIPKALPEYTVIRELVLGWKNSNGFQSSNTTSTPEK